MSRRWSGRARGAVLLEALIAVVVLGTIGSAGAWLTAESIRSVTRVYQEENNFRAAARLLTAVSLWPREDLDRHLGTTAQGPWRLRVDRTEPTLYAVTVVDAVTGRALLRAVLLREDPGS